MVTKLNKKNPYIKELYSKKFKPKIVKPKKVKEVAVVKKILRVKSIQKFILYQR